MSMKALSDRFRKYWMRFALRGIRYSDNYSKMDTIYRIDDPWHMTSPSQQYRFRETNQVILEQFGRVGSILEIGCGEGHQSLFFQQICDHLVGLDVSARAIKRAGRKCPESKFLVGTIFSQEVEAYAPFDLVVACEVLYYMEDVSVALQRIRELGRNVLVTYFGGEMPTLDAHILHLPGFSSQAFQFEGSRWRAAWCRFEKD